MEEENILEFVETIDGKEYGHFRIFLQEYWEYADKDDDEGKPIYNVAIEFNEEPHDIFSYTLDIYEDYDFDGARAYYKMILDGIDGINKPRESK